MQKKKSKILNRFLIWGGVFVFLMGLSAMTTCVEMWVFMPKKTQCLTNLRCMQLATKKIISRQQSSKESFHITGLPLLTDYLDYKSLICPGFGAGKSSYLFVPKGLNDETVPIYVDRFYNHLESGKHYWFLQRLTESGGICVVYYDGRYKCLNLSKTKALLKKFSDENISVYDLAGNKSSIMERDSTAPRAEWRVYHDDAHQVYFALGVALFTLGILRTLRQKKEAKASVPIPQTQPENEC